MTLLSHLKWLPFPPFPQRSEMPQRRRLVWLIKLICLVLWLRTSHFQNPVLDSSQFNHAHMLKTETRHWLFSELVDPCLLCEGTPLLTIAAKLTGSFQGRPILRRIQWRLKIVFTTSLLLFLYGKVSIEHKCNIDANVMRSIHVRFHSHRIRDMLVPIIQHRAHGRQFVSLFKLLFE